MTPPFARWTDPETSHEAAEYVAPRLTALQEEVYEWAKTHREPWTLKDIAASMRVRHPKSSESTWRTRVSELRDKAMIEFVGYYRLDDAGKRHRLWQAVRKQP